VKLLALCLALLTATAAQAQAQAQKVFRCVDERGGTYYTEKPGPGCKPTRIDSAPGTAPAAKPAAKAGTQASDTQGAKTPVKQSGPTPLTVKAHCDGLSREAARMNSGRSSLPSASAEARLAGIQKELERSCR